MRQVEVPWARRGSGFTLLFEAWAFLLARKMAVSEAAETLGIQDTRLLRMLTQGVDKAHAGNDWSRFVRVRVVETSRRKGHRYVTCFVDLDSGNLLYMIERRDAATVGAFAVEVIAHQGSPEAIEEVAMDMSPPFQSGVAEHLPGASIVFDRYHVMALAGKATDEMRREVAREEGGLEKDAMWSLRGKKERLKAEQLEQRERLWWDYAKLWRSLSRMQRLADAWRCTAREEAEAHLKMVYLSGRRCRLEPIKKLCATLTRHWDDILDYYRHTTTSAVMEGLNSCLQLAKEAEGLSQLEELPHGVPHTIAH